MPVAIVQHIAGAAGSFATTYNGGATPLTISNTPGATDVLILRLTQSRSGSKFTSVSGCNATWVRVANGNNADESVQFWKGTGAAMTTGTVTATATINTWARGSLTHVSGLTATTVVADGTVSNASSGADPGPVISATNGQIVFASAYQNNMNEYPSVGTPPDPATGWTFDAVGADLNGYESATGYRIPTSTANHQVTANNTGTGTGFHLLMVMGDAVSLIPEVTGDMTGTGTMSGEAIQVDIVTGALAGTGTMSGTVDGEPVLTGPTPPTASEAGLVPLAVRVGNQHITREVSGLQFRKEAVGGLKSISLKLARPLDSFDVNLDPLTEVYVYDGRTAEIIAQGRLTDPGRSASAGDGQQWDMVAFPPGLTDRTFPYILVDTNLEPFTRSTYCTRNASTQSDERDEDNPSLLLAAEEGKTVSTSWVADMAYRSIRRAGMKLARVRASVDCGVTDANYVVHLVTRTGTGAGSSADSAASSTTAGILAAVVVTDFTNGDDVVSVRAVRDTAGTTGAEAHWFEFWEFAARALLLDASGAEITTGYSTNTVLAHEVVNDLLGRVLDQIDGANSVVDDGGAYAIDQLAYPDGVTAEQVLADLMALEPAYRYWIEPDGAGGYVLHWEPWPTTVRYEVTLNGGGDFPSSSQEIYNEVTVRWRGSNGRTRTVTRTLACQILDDAGVTRSTIIDAGDEIGSVTGAARLGDNFLAEHNVPANAGTVVVDRPIRDLLTGRMVRPHQIEPGTLIRVRGVESYPDALNPDSRDGLTIFRIWSVTYNSDSDTAACELDIPSRSTTNALVKLAKRRNRKR